MDELTPGQRVGRLEVLRELGRGAFGRVYLARDTLLDRPVALKVVPGLPEATEKHRARILREARAAGRLSSPHVIAIYDLHEMPDGTWMFEMEYAEGGTLADLLAKQGKLDPDRATRIARGIARALAAAHAQGIVHGDVKPSNVLLDHSGEPKLADFGFARLADERALSQSSAEGTPTHMAPEVFLGEPASPASDIWAFGVVLYRMLTGRLPFAVRDWASLFLAVQHAEPLPAGPDVPEALARLALLCLAKRASERPSSWREMLRVLGDGPAEASVAPPSASSERDVALVGREREVERLAEAVARVAAGAGTCVLLSGPTGSGTSSLARAAQQIARRNGFVCIEAAVSPLQGLVRPLLVATRACVEGPLSSSLEEARFGSAAGIAKRLLDEPAMRFEPLGQTLWVAEQLLRHLAADRPLAVFVEDAEEAGPEDLKAIQHLQLRLPEAPILLLVTCAADRGRTDTATRLAEAQGTARIDVGPLGRAAAQRLLLRAAEVAYVAPDVARHVHEVAQGNPLFTIELCRHLVASGVIARAGDSVSRALVPGLAWGTGAFPRRLHDLYATRLAQIGEEDRALLDAAAVDGIVLDGEALAAVMDRPLLAVLRSLQRLYRESGFVVPGPTGYRFANATLREGVYQDLAAELRRALHLAFARHLEARGPGGVDPERVGLHWERGGEPLRARPYLRRASAVAIRRQEVARAIDLAARSGIEPGRIDAAEALAEADLAFDLADCYYGAGRAADAESLVRLLLDAPHADETLRLRAFVHLALIRFYRHGIGAVEEAELRRAADALPEGRDRGLASYLLGVIAKYRGDLDEAQARLLEADSVYRACRLDAEHSSALDQLASLSMRRGRLREACALYEDAARIAAHSGRLPNAAASRVNAALASLQLGRLEGVAEVLERAIAEFDIEGTQNLAAHARALLGGVRFDHGDLDGALELAADAASRFERNAYLPGLADAAALEARVLSIRGHLGAAEAALARVEAAATKTQSRGDLQRAYGLRALVDAWRGAPIEAAAARAAEYARAEGRARADAVLAVAEACAYRSPVPSLPDLAGMLPDGRSEEALVAVARSVAAAAAAGPEAAVALLRDAAAALRGDLCGGRAFLRGLAALFDARAHVAEGDMTGAEAAAVAGVEAARALGHVWLELRLLSLLAALFPSKGYAPAFAALLDSRSGALPEGARPLLREAWSRRGL